MAIALAAVLATGAAASNHDNAVDASIRQFLAQPDAQPAYRAIRRLEAATGTRRGWLEAATTFDPATGLSFEVLAEGGSGYIRDKVLRAVLEGERQAIAKGETARASLAPANYQFLPNGIDADGLANVTIAPRRKERVLVSGTMFLTPSSGHLVRLQGRLARNPSFWVRNVDILRQYARIGGFIVPISMESRADLRLFGEGTLRVTYTYREVGGQPVP